MKKKKLERSKIWKKSIAELSKRDKQLAKHIRANGGVVDFEIDSRMPPYTFIVRSIISQQISGAAARAITKRFIALFPRNRLDYALLMTLTDEQSKGAGLSNNKMRAIRDLAQKVLDGSLPQERHLHRMTDDEIIERLVEVRGVGVWTVQMLLMFRFGRLDVFAVDDLIVKKGLCKVLGVDKAPTRKEMLLISEKWKPHRTLVSKLFWAIA